MDAWAAARSRDLLSVECRLRRDSDGAYLWHQTRAAPVRDPDGQILEWLGTSTDLEQLKLAEAGRREAEERFRLFVANVHEYALVQTDPRGIITSWNPGAHRLFGYSADQMLGRDFSVLLTPEDFEAGVFRKELELVAEGQRHEDARWLVRQNGSRFWARWISEPISNEAGEFRGVAKVMRDETDRQRAADLVQRSLAEKQELLKEVHHRVKNNLQVIVSLLNMQTSQIEDERILTPFQEARNRVLAISSIHELLYRAESFAGIALSDYARQLAPGLLRFYGLESRVQMEIRGDRTTLELERAVPYGMLLNELVSNACKHAFTPSTTGTIVISIVPVGTEVEVIVEDSGRGLPDGFDYRKATSLGLKLVHGLVRQLHGTIEISSKQGTSVKVRFPVKGRNSGG
jgi:PAS domain S-box-containing protein